MKIFWIILFLVMGISQGYSQQQKGKKLISRVDALIESRFRNISPGCAILVAQKGKVVYQKAFGLANIELNVTMQTQSVFRLGSITKEFTAAAILQLAEQGKLDLHDSVQTYMNDFPYKGHIITIENLLTHTSGLIDFQVLNFHIPDAVRISFAPRRIVDSLKYLPLQFPPGSKYSYSNTNYLLLGLIIEKISGQSYKKYMEENIFQPLHLTSTFYDDPVSIIPGRSSGYAKNKDRFLNADYISMNWPFAAGALMSTTADLYKWHESLYSYKLLKKETFEKAVVPFKLSNGEASPYGYGFFIKKWKGITSIGHGGAIDGFRTMEMYFPETDLYITMLFNSDDDAHLYLFEEAATMFIGKPLESSYKDIKIDDKILESYTGTYVFVENQSVSLKIYKKNGRLYADLSNGTGSNMALLAQSDSLFYLPDVRRIQTTVEFVREGDNVKALNWTQEERHLANRKE